MQLVSKYSAALITAFLLFGSAYANPFSLWDIAQPVPTSRSLPSGPGGGDVFTFTTPGVNSCIAVGYKLYSDSGCTSLINSKTYQGINVDSAHANKTFYINASGLYALASSIGAASAQCAEEVDEYNLSSFVSTPINCSSGTSQCTSTSTHALPTLTSNEQACA